MRKKCSLIILGSVFFHCITLVWSASAEMRKVNDAELARMNVSVTSTSARERHISVDKSEARQLTEKMVVNYDKEVDFSSSVKVMESIGLTLNIKGQETFRYEFGGASSNTIGGIIGVKSH